MLLFKTPTKPVMKSTDAHGKILNFEPKAFDLSVPGQAVSLARDGETIQNFTISGLTAETTKLHELERRSFQGKVESEVLLRLKSIEEKAYAEAHALGVAEGKERGFNEIKADIQSHLDSLKEIGNVISELKARLLIENEKHLMMTIFNIAKAIALKEIKESPENILTVMKMALENAQSEEEIVLRLNPDDAAFLEKTKTTVSNPFERLTHLRIEPTEAVTRGGAIIETNYGIVDASIETRVSKVFETISAKIPPLPLEDKKA